MNPLTLIVWGFMFFQNIVSYCLIVPCCTQWYPTNGV